MILDATAGNRTMWRHKDSENVVYVDIQRQLEVKPTVFCDTIQPPFREGVFDMIFYDPPHTYATDKHYHCFPRRTKEYYETWKDTAIPRYYGWERYRSRSQLISYIFQTQMELYALLKDDGLLWLKWNEMTISLSNILSVFTQWRELMRLYISSPSQTAGKHQTYWVCMEKKQESTKQLQL